MSCSLDQLMNRGLSSVSMLQVGLNGEKIMGLHTRGFSQRVQWTKARGEGLALTWCKYCFGRNCCAGPIEPQMFDKEGNSCPSVTETLAIQATSNVFEQHFRNERVKSGIERKCPFNGGATLRVLTGN
ncbi:hypothetical protein L1049_023917 [Liquidambar formosana]|uniref:Uncharacterized protein n=1 Tax=Liquidambar formosana TaxID=63359 RepID=A0AAP0X4C1_LIQFO